MYRALAYLIAVAGLVASACAWTGPARADDAAPPNIIYLISDDQGWKDVGFHGSDIQTPHIDALAKGGTELARFYSQPFCTQARAALMTGRYPMRYGLQTAVIPSAGRYGLDLAERTLPQALREAGYRTVMVGKWHLGHAERAYWPESRGFDYHYGAVLGEIDYFGHDAHGHVDWIRNGETVHEEGYVTELIGDDAVRQIEAHDGSKPLFLYVAFTAPHAPYQAPQAYLDRYAHIQDPNRRAYAAMITSMDDQVGRIVAALEKRGLRKNSFLVYHTDNGGPISAAVTGEVDTSGGAIPCNNGPWRDGKATVYEGGTRVVALANWPGHVPAGAKVDGPMHIVDMYTTLLTLGRASLEQPLPPDGLDMWPTIASGKASPRQEVVYNIGPFIAGLSQGDWKLVWHAVLPSRIELFNLAEDPGEANNLAEKEPARVAALQQRIQELARQAKKPLLLAESGPWLKRAAFGSVATPEDADALAREP